MLSKMIEKLYQMLREIIAIKEKKKKVKKSILPLYPPQGEMEDAEIIFFLKIPIQMG